jgi:hypothetical protein
MRQRHSTDFLTNDRIFRTSTCLNSKATVQVLLVLLLVTASACSADARRLRQYSINNMVAAMGGMQVDVGHLLFGGPGLPSIPSPQRHYKVNCENPRPTIVLVPGRHVTRHNSNSSSSGTCFPSPTHSRSNAASCTAPLLLHAQLMIAVLQCVRHCVACKLLTLLLR